VTRPGSGGALAGILLALAVLVASRAAEAEGDPNIDWWTIETKHFRVHYPRSVEDVAERVATIAETVFLRLTPALGYAPTSFTEIVLTDATDDANGSATSLPYNTIQLYVTAPNDLSTLGDYDDWYLELVTHEYTHILHTDNITGVPAIINAVIGKTYSPNQAQPRWILEGLAVLEESQHTSAGRNRSSLFDMYLRADVLDDYIAGLDQISSGAYRWPQGNLWYLYGSRFLRWITDQYGPNTMRAVSADYGASLAPWGINRAIRRATGRTYEELYEGFKDRIRRSYGEQMAAVQKRGLREGARLTFDGKNVYSPRFVPRVARPGKGEEIVFYRDDLDERTGIYRIPLDAPRDGGTRPEDLVARTDDISSPAFTPTGDLVFNSVSYYRNVYARNDLFFLPRGATSTSGREPERHRLTTGLRALGADVSPDGRHLVFTVNGKGTSYLEITDLTPEGNLASRRDLVPSARYEQAYTPRYSHDGSKVAYSVWTAGGFRDIRIVDVATGQFHNVTYDRALDLEPVWSPDDRTLYFSSDRSGIFNIYAYDVARGSFLAVTNVRTGAFMPDLSEDGRTLVYVGYTSRGFDLYVMPLDPARFLPAVDAPDDRPDPPPEPDPIPLARHPYNPLPTFWPRNYFLSIAPGNWGDNAVTFTASGSDAVGLHTVTLNAVADPKASGPSLSLDYTYGRLPVDLDLEAFAVVLPRTGYILNGQNTQYDELDTGITSGVSYTKNDDDFITQTFGFSYSAAHFKGNLPVGPNLDPTAPIAPDPPQGNINLAHLGYSFSNVESGLDPAGSWRGAALDLGLDYGSRYTASSYAYRAIQAVLTGYIPMPWPGFQTLATRTAGAISAGDYPRASSYEVGGYDLTQNNVQSVLSGAFNGVFVLRGYPARVYAGSEYLLQTFEYRVPILKPDHGLSSLPIYLTRLDGNLFVDYGGAFDTLELSQIHLFHDGALIDSPQLHTSVGMELWFGMNLGYGLTTQFKLGYAYGFSAEAIHGGQPYFLASSAF
jgi:hypothetical protein